MDFLDSVVYVCHVEAPYKPYYIVSNGFATQERGWYKLEGSVETPNVGK